MDRGITGLIYTFAAAESWNPSAVGTSISGGSKLALFEGPAPIHVTRIYTGFYYTFTAAESLSTLCKGTSIRWSKGAALFGGFRTFLGPLSGNFNQPLLKELEL